MDNTYSIICVAEDLLGFIGEVNRYLFEGWELVGGISITHGPEGKLFFAQAVKFVSHDDQ